jgi:hypothetical protein
MAGAARGTIEIDGRGHGRPGSLSVSSGNLPPINYIPPAEALCSALWNSRFSGRSLTACRKASIAF